MTLDEESRRGMEAERIMSEPLVKEAFDKVEASIIEALRRCDVRKEDEMKSLTLSLQLLGQIKGQFVTVIQTGQLARKSLMDRAKGLFRAA